MEIRITNNNPSGMILESNGRFDGNDMIFIFARMELYKEEFVSKVEKILDITHEEAKINVEEDIKTAKKMLGKNTQCSGSEIAFLKEV